MVQDGPCFVTVVWYSAGPGLLSILLSGFRRPMVNFGPGFGAGEYGVYCPGPGMFSTSLTLCLRVIVQEGPCFVTLLWYSAGPGLLSTLLSGFRRPMVNFGPGFGAGEYGV